MQRDAEIYTVYTYGSLVVVTLCVTGQGSIELAVGGQFIEVMALVAPFVLCLVCLLLEVHVCFVLFCFVLFCLFWLVLFCV